MTDASYRTIAIASREAAARSRQSERRSIFAAILEALHNSRRRQALRIIRQYRHLIEQPKTGKLPARLPVPNEKVLITTIAIVFLLLHILGAMIIQRAPADRHATPQEQPRLSLYD